jgi:hypothetical protein
MKVLLCSRESTYLDGDLVPASSLFSTSGSIARTEELRVFFLKLNEEVYRSVCLVTEVVHVVERRRTSSYKGRDGEQEQE